MTAPATELASCPRFARASFVFTTDLISLSSFHNFNPKMASKRIKPAEKISANYRDLFQFKYYLHFSFTENPNLKNEQLLTDRAASQ